MSVDRFEVITATVRADHLARFDQLAARRSARRSDLLRRAIDGLLACDDLAGGYVGAPKGPLIDGFATEEITARLRTDHVGRLDQMAARRGIDRSELVGRAMDRFLAQEAMIGAFGVAETAAWFAPARDSSVWASLRSAAAAGRRTRAGPRSARRVGPGARSTRT